MKQNYRIVFVVIWFVMLSCSFLPGYNSNVILKNTDIPSFTYTHTSAYSPTYTSTQTNTQGPVITSITVQPETVKNGDKVQIIVETNKSGLTITADIAKLDEIQNIPIIFSEIASGVYQFAFTISYANQRQNGIKDIQVTARDKFGNVAIKTGKITLLNPSPELDKNPPNDEFEGKIIDTSKWANSSCIGGSVSQDDRLIVYSNADESNSCAGMRSLWYFKDNFDVQIDFSVGSLGILKQGGGITGARLAILNQCSIDWGGSGDSYYYYASCNNSTNIVYTTSHSGKLRLIRENDTLIFLYDGGFGWKELLTMELIITNAKIFIGNDRWKGAPSITTYYHHFHINNGKTSYLLMG
jgi:hypothetical protein